MSTPLGIRKPSTPLPSMMYYITKKNLEVFQWYTPSFICCSTSIICCTARKILFTIERWSTRFNTYSPFLCSIKQLLSCRTSRENSSRWFNPSSVAWSARFACFARGRILVWGSRGLVTEDFLYRRRVESRGLLYLGQLVCFSRFIDSSSEGDKEGEDDSKSSRSRRSSIRGSLTFLSKDASVPEDWEGKGVVIERLLW